MKSVGFVSSGSSSNGLLLKEVALFDLKSGLKVASRFEAFTDEGEMIWLAIARVMQVKKIEKLIRMSFTENFICNQNNSFREASHTNVPKIQYV
tara:strand:- start:322 stop:603 length:282 start_codon:yes stop_codon:yes gene_type:complete